VRESRTFVARRRRRNRAKREPPRDNSPAFFARFFRGVALLRIWLSCVLVLALLGVAAWAADFITLQGERTVYTANCVQGTWQGKRCSGKLVAGERHRFRALKAHQEVLFWTVGSKEPSGKFTDCHIKDGRNWTCKPSPDISRAIAREMSLGKPVPDPSGQTRSFHPVAKWRWMLLRYGVAIGKEAEA
jgi:hypothetical protein